MPTEFGRAPGTCETSTAGPVTVKVVVSTLAIMEVTVTAAGVTVLVKIAGVGRTIVCSVPDMVNEYVVRLCASITEGAARAQRPRRVIENSIMSWLVVSRVQRVWIGM